MEKSANSQSFPTSRIAASTLDLKIAASYWASTDCPVDAAIQDSSSSMAFLLPPRFWASRRSSSSPSTCLAMARSHVENRAPREGSYRSMDSERAASVSWERSRTVSDPIRPLPHLVSWALTTGPNVSQSSYHAAWSLQRSRPMKPVVIGVSMGAEGYHLSRVQRIGTQSTQRAQRGTRSGKALYVRRPTGLCLGPIHACFPG